MKLYKYHGAGNDFLIGDNRRGELQLSDSQITNLCDRRYGIGADGLILLEESEKADFRMVFYNSDASRGMMCGNGGRCIISFARRLGLKGFDFEAADGLHRGHIYSAAELRKSSLQIPYDPTNPNREIVRLEMREVSAMTEHPEVIDKVHFKIYNTPLFMNTGSRHVILHTHGVENIDLDHTAPDIRYAPAFEPQGTNVNFIEVEDENSLFIRSYEKGVEGETFACGTGAIASAIAFRHYQHAACGNTYMTHIRTLKEHLAVEFVLTPEGAKDICIIGPSTFVAEIHIS